MPFCKYCGTQLNEGEVCKCQMPAASEEAPAAAESEAAAPVAAEIPAVSEEVPVVPVEQPAPAADGAAGEKAKEYLGIFLAAVKELPGIWKAPVTEGKKFVENVNMVTSVIFMVLQAIAAGIFSTLVIGKINSLMGLGGSYLEGYKFSGVKAFFLTLLFSLLYSALLSALYLAAGKILKSKAGFAQAMAVAAVRSAAVLPLIVLSWILFFLNIGAGTAVFFGASVLGMLYSLAAVKGVDGMNDDKALYTVFIITVVFVLIVVFIMSKSAVLYVPKAIKDTIGSMGDLEDILNYLM